MGAAERGRGEERITLAEYIADLQRRRSATSSQATRVLRTLLLDMTVEQGRHAR